MQGLNSLCRKDGNAASLFSARSSMWSSGTCSSLPSLPVSPRLGGLRLAAGWPGTWTALGLSSICADCRNIKIKWITFLWIYLYLIRSERLFQFSPGHETEDLNIYFGQSDNGRNFLFQLKCVFSDYSKWLDVSGQALPLFLPWCSLQYMGPLRDRNRCILTGAGCRKEVILTNLWKNKRVLLVIFGTSMGGSSTQVIQKLRGVVGNYEVLPLWCCQEGTKP